MSDPHWPDAFTQSFYDWKESLYRRVEPRVSFVEPIDDYDLEKFERWLSLSLDYQLLLREMRGGLWEFKESWFERNPRCPT